MLTQGQIEDEIDAIREQILTLTTQATASYASHGRQVVMESARGKLEVLYSRLNWLLGQLRRLEAANGGPTGIRVRYGIPIR